jgi:AraC-like DNA-binding protein
MEFRVVSGQGSVIPLAAGLLKRLVDIIRTEQVPSCMRVRARTAHSLRSVDIDTPMLAVMVQGLKRYRDPESGRWIRVAPGEAFLIPYSTSIDIENIPDPASGWYSAVCIPLPEHVLNAARQLVRLPATAAPARSAVTCIPLEPYVHDIMKWLDAAAAEDHPRACHALVGVVLTLCSQGHGGVLNPPRPTLSARIRGLVAADPTRDWSSAHLEEQLAMSGATLRRHLASEGVSLRQVIGDARLSHGLTLLLSTRLPVKAVAQQAGYSSVSAFVKRFRERYGVEPSRVGGEEPEAVRAQKAGPPQADGLAAQRG